MNKRIISLLLVLSLVVGLLVSAVPVFAVTTQGLSATKTSAEAGETFSVTLKAPSVSEPISDASFKFTFDKDALEVTAVDAPNVDGATKVSPTVSEANNNGFVSATINSLDGDPNVTFSGYSLTATFKVKSGATAKAYDFTVSDFSINSLDEYGGPKTIMGISAFSESEKKIQVTVTAPAVKVTGVTLNKSSLTLTAGNNETLIATVAPDDATDKSVSWTSSDNSVATVSNGTVTALKKGTATITVKTNDGNKTATCTVTVNCVHANTTPYSAVPSTCKVQGHAAYTKCNDCGAIISGSADLLPYAAHTYGTWIPEVPATHDANGEKGHYHCSVCEKNFDSGKNEISSLVINKDANHGLPATAWKSDATHHWHECKVVACGVVIDSTKATHTFEWKTDTAATEDATGVKHEECNVCGYKRNENTTIPKLDHTHTVVHHDAVPGSCKAEGNIEYWTCSSPKCAGKYYSEETCTVTVENITVPKDENNHLHTEIRGKKDATCTEDGYTGDTYCTDCGKKLADGETVKATGHTYENGKCKSCGAKDPDYKAPEKDKETSPQTGDNSHMTLWIILASVSSLAVLALTLTKKKRTVR